MSPANRHSSGCSMARHGAALPSAASVVLEYAGSGGGQNGRRPGGQPLLNTDRLWHSKGHIAKPGITGKTYELRPIRAIVSASNYAVANHCAAKQFAGGGRAAEHATD